MNDYLAIANGILTKCDPNVTNVVIPDGVTAIDKFAFCGCESLKSIVLPNSITDIRYHAFAYCESLETITIPNSVKFIGNSAFASCKSLRSIIIPNGVTSIEDDTFNHCESLESIIIPSSVTSIRDTAFYGRKKNMMIQCNRNSYAEEYAKSHNIHCKIINFQSIKRTIWKCRQAKAFALCRLLHLFYKCKINLKNRKFCLLFQKLWGLEGKALQVSNQLTTS